MRNGVDSKLASFYYPSHMNCGHFLISVILGFAFQSDFNFSKYMTKFNTLALIVIYLVDYIFIKSRLLESPLADPVQNAIIGGVAKHRHGIFIPLLVHEFLLKKRDCFKTFVFASYKLLFASSLTYAFWLIFYISNSKFAWIELNFRNAVGNSEKI